MPNFHRIRQGGRGERELPMETKVGIEGRGNRGSKMQRVGERRRGNAESEEVEGRRRGRKHTMRILMLSSFSFVFASVPSPFFFGKGGIIQSGGRKLATKKDEKGEQISQLKSLHVLHWRHCFLGRRKRVLKRRTNRQLLHVVLLSSHLASSRN